LVAVFAFDLLAGLAILVALSMAVPVVMRTIHAIERAAGASIGGFLQAIASAVQDAAQEAFDVVAASDAVKERLGRPLVLPSIEDFRFPQQPGTAPVGQIEFQFLISGPLGKAEVKAVAQAADEKLSIVRLVVTPLDGGGPIVVRPADD
jgi:hypothetical protein